MEIVLPKGKNSTKLNYKQATNLKLDEGIQS